LLAKYVLKLLPKLLQIQKNSPAGFMPRIAWHIYIHIIFSHFKILSQIPGEKNGNPVMLLPTQGQISHYQPKAYP
jgi:hypothetical protein